MKMHVEDMSLFYYTHNVYEVMLCPRINDVDYTSEGEQVETCLNVNQHATDNRK
jgi:hypothetical protein